jgi:hypothetical protein
MRYDETEFPSVEDIEDDFGKALLDIDEEWLEAWERRTISCDEFWSRVLDLPDAA